MTLIDFGLELLTLLTMAQLIWGRKASGMIRVWVGPIPFFLATTAESAEVDDDCCCLFF